MTLPLLISVLVAGTSTVLPPKKKEAVASSSMARSSGYLEMLGSQMFLTGIVVGVSLSWGISAELRRNRWLDRLRLMLLEFFTLDPWENPTTPGTTFRLPPTQGDGTIISPHASLTSSLWVTTIRIPPRHELPFRKAKGMEFYQVLQGKGEWGSTSSTKEDRTRKSNALIKGDAFVVEVHSSRWIANTSASEDLVLLRSNDAGFYIDPKSYDQIVPSNNSSGFAMARGIEDIVNSNIQRAGSCFSSLFGNRKEGKES